MTFANAQQRFSTRAADYALYRPGYPPETLDVLRAWCGLQVEHTIADIGSGTGLLAKLFLENGNRVFGVEPNPEMRATTLPARSVDLVAAAQAFHWFDAPSTRREFRRILKPKGRVVILWNERLLEETAFLRDYEALLRRFGTDYAKVDESYPRAEQMLAFFGECEFTSHSLPNAQDFDFDGLCGRLRSSSYVPAPDHPQFAPMLRELRRIFAAHETNGVVRIEYRTRIYAGSLDP